MKNEEYRERFLEFLSKDDADFKGSLIVRAVNYKKYKNRIEVYRMVTADIALAAYCVVSASDVFMSMVFPDDWIEKIGFHNKDEVIDFAIENTSKMFPVKVESDDHMEEEGVNLFEAVFDEQPEKMMISCDGNPNGATTLFYPGVTKKIGEIMGSFAAVCMNTMDVMIFKPGDPQIKAYRMLASTENEYGEVLSGEVIYFNSEGEMLRC